MSQSTSVRFSRFEERTVEPRAMKYVRRFGIIVACTFSVFALMSGYRAIVQIYRVDLVSPDTLRVGAPIRVWISTSGRVTSSATLVLVQGTRIDTLARRIVRGNHNRSFRHSLNPFPVRDSLVVVVPASALARYNAGPATLRAIGLGASQWMRVPPPTIRERAVVIVKGSSPE
jgi:hypothetical protein